MKRQVHLTTLLVTVTLVFVVSVVSGCGHIAAIEDAQSGSSAAELLAADYPEIGGRRVSPSWYEESEGDVTLRGLLSSVPVPVKPGVDEVRLVCADDTMGFRSYHALTVLMTDSTVLAPSFSFEDGFSRLVAIRTTAADGELYASKIEFVQDQEDPGEATSDYPGYPGVAAESGRKHVELARTPWVRLHDDHGHVHGLVSGFVTSETEETADQPSQEHTSSVYIAVPGGTDRLRVFHILRVFSPVSLAATRQRLHIEEGFPPWAEEVPVSLEDGRLMLRESR